MRGGILLFGLILVAGASACRQTKTLATTGNASSIRLDSKIKSASGNKIDFETQVKPIFEARCRPCHLNGGQMFERLPFDRPATIRSLGPKLFTRIKNENERRVIGDFLAQP